MTEDGMSQGLNTQLLEEVARLAQLVEKLTLEIRALQDDRSVARGEWFSLRQAYPLLGLRSEGALRDRIKNGRLPRFSRKTGKGCWINVGKSEDVPRYKVHISNSLAALNRDSI